MRRLTELQYRQAIADIFGPDIEIVGRFEPDHRRDGLLAIGSAWASITPVGFEQYDNMARNIADQVVGEDHRGRFIRCTPVSETGPDDACTEQVVRRFGHKLFRRPLTEADVAPRVEIAREAATTFGDFYEGLKFALASLLASPEFLFRVEVAEPDPENPGRMRLDSFSRATRLSYLLWNTTPDDVLLQAAEDGGLHDERILARQVERLLESQRLENGVRAFFIDMLGFDKFDEVSKDASIYPAYTSELGEDAQEQTLRAIVDHLVTRNGDYRDLFTLRRFPMTRQLGLVYQVPVATRDGWEDYWFSEDEPRAGLLSHVSLLALHSHPGRSSPTLRGKFIRETFLCQSVPPPPADVDFTMDEEFEVLKTARARLERHRSDPSCSGCHMLMDPIGLTLEKFDGIGAYRMEENGVPIDASGELQDVEFAGASGLGAAMREHPGVPACLVETLYQYAVGRNTARGEREFIEFLESRFGELEFDVVDLLREIATSRAFYAVSEPRGAEPTTEAKR